MKQNLHLQDLKWYNLFLNKWREELGKISSVKMYLFKSIWSIDTCWRLTGSEPPGNALRPFCSPTRCCSSPSRKRCSGSTTRWRRTSTTSPSTRICPIWSAKWRRWTRTTAQPSESSNKPTKWRSSIWRRKPSTDTQLRLCGSTLRFRDWIWRLSRRKR